MTCYINLFDMHQKYADVVSLAEAVEYFDSIGAASGALALTPTRTGRNPVRSGALARIS
jgi:hypothetical protein